MPGICSYDYAVIRVTPRVERQEFLNVGIILFSRTACYLEARIELDLDRLRALAPDLDIKTLQEQLALIPRICAGEGPIGKLDRSEIFHWLVAPHSTVIQCSPVHAGQAEDLPRVMDQLMERLVRRSKATGSGVS